MDLDQCLVKHSYSFPPLAWAIKSRKVQFASGVDLTLEERQAFALAMLTFQSRQVFLFEHVRPTSKLAMSACIGFLIADFVERHKTLNTPSINNVLLVTRQVGAAIDFLQDVRLDWKLALSDIWEVKRSYTVADTTKQERPWLIVAPPIPGNLSINDRDVGAVVIDASHILTLERLEELLEHPSIKQALVKIIVLPIGFRSQAKYLTEWKNWCWAPKYITQQPLDNLRSPVNHTQQSEYQETLTRDIFICEDIQLDSSLNNARSKLTLLSSLGNFFPYPLKLAWAIYQKLASLPIKLSIYEQSAFHLVRIKTIKEQLEWLSNVEIPIALKSSSQIVWASEWRPLVESLKKAYECLRGSEPAKFWMTANIVEKYLQSRSGNVALVIACNSQIEARVLTSELSYILSELPEALQLNSVVITSLKQLASNHMDLTATLLITSPLSSRWRHLAISYSNITVLAYEHEARLARSLSESGIKYLQTQIQDSSRAQNLSALGIKIEHTSSYSSPNKYKSQINLIGKEENSLRDYNTKEVGSYSLIPDWTMDFLDSVDIRATSFVPDSRSNDTPLSTLSGKQIRIFLKSGGELVVPEGYRFDIYRLVTDELDSKFAERLEKGDIIILVDSGNLSTLFDRMVEALEAHPRFALLHVWLDLWDISKQAVLEKHNYNYGALHTSLLGQSHKITEQAVRSWYSGTLAPREDELLYAMIDLSGGATASKYRASIRTAVGHIRGMRRLVGRRMRQIVKSAAVSKQPDDLLEDKDLQIAVEDVLAAACPVVVESIELIT